MAQLQFSVEVDVTTAWQRVALVAAFVQSDASWQWHAAPRIAWYSLRWSGY
ncbi:hypothetical protein FHS56_001742 [Thermonema lapsum]|uniref:Uncharacterized protein n=1 Tax=Thermonema lapsum TaxID=28195 RepID=A0A846MRZ7_9BACT|nr:hypothetical protein [Thermonema lapsum]NIK74229.1 hypothetical protein [Thermonema lapsum]